MTGLMQVVGKAKGGMFFCCCHCFRYMLIMLAKS